MGEVSEQHTSKYAVGHDMIAFLETKLISVDEYIEEIEFRKRRLENSLRMDIEIRAEDKASGLTNEKKRQIAFEDLADCNDELQSIITDLKDVRREQKKLRVEIENERRDSIP
jgi:hypothetical protein